MSAYRVLDLFSGIGGFTLGLERTGGFKTVAFCETDTYCKRVLAKHWPGVPIYHDIRDLTAERLRADGIVCDVLTGGFPCQDISVAGKGAGIDGERSGLWSEYSRLIGEVRPRYAIVENVAVLLARGLDRILGDLAALGYDCEWHCIPASAVGALHRRDRLWIVAHSDRQSIRDKGRVATIGSAGEVQGNGQEWQRLRPDVATGSGCQDVAHADGRRRQGLGLEEHGDQQRASGDKPDGCGASGWRNGAAVADASSSGLPLSEFPFLFGAGRWEEWRAIAECGWWRAEPDVGRVAHGIPARVHRLRALGNAVVPQIPELIGRAILQAEARSCR